jgi:hypothetical protein
VLTGRDPERLKRVAFDVDARSTAAFDATDPAALKRFFEDLPDPIDHLMVTDAGERGTYFGVETGAFDTYLPDHGTLAAIDAPIQLLVSDASLPAFSQVAERLSKRLCVKVTPTPGTHFPFLDHPDELAETVRPFLRGLSDYAAIDLLGVGPQRGLAAVAQKFAGYCTTRKAVAEETGQITGTGGGDWSDHGHQGQGLQHHLVRRAMPKQRAAPRDLHRRCPARERLGPRGLLQARSGHEPQGRRARKGAASEASVVRRYDFLPLLRPPLR